MSHQDFNIIHFNNPKKVQEKNKGQYEIQNKLSDEQKSINAKNYKIENEQENFKIDYVPKELGKEIIQLRSEHKLNQKDFAQKIYVQQTQIQDIETGKAIYNQDAKKVIKQIERTFKINFKNK